MAERHLFLDHHELCVNLPLFRLDNMIAGGERRVKNRVVQIVVLVGVLLALRFEQVVRHTRD